MASRSATSRQRAAEQSGRIGVEVRRARLELALTYQQVANLAGVSWSTAVRVELGDPRLAIATSCAVAEAVGLDLVLHAYPGRRPSLRDTGQLQLAQQLIGQAHPAWHPELEVLVGTHGEACDVGFFGGEEILDVEIERRADDLQHQLRRADRKRELLADRHQRPVRLVMVFEDTPRNRTAIQPHASLIRTTLPAGSREILGAIRTGRPLGRDGMLWLRRRPVRLDRSR